MTMLADGMLTGFPGSQPQKPSNPVIQKYVAALNAITAARPAAPEMVSPDQGGLPPFPGAMPSEPPQNQSMPPMGMEPRAPFNVGGDVGMGSWAPTVTPEPTFMDKFSKGLSAASDKLSPKDGQQGGGQIVGSDMLARQQAQLAQGLQQIMPGRQAYGDGGEVDWLPKHWTDPSGSFAPARLPGDAPASPPVAQPSGPSPVSFLGSRPEPTSEPVARAAPRSFVDNITDTVGMPRLMSDGVWSRDKFGHRNAPTRAQDAAAIFLGLGGDMASGAARALRDANEDRYKSMEAERAAAALIGKFQGQSTLAAKEHGLRASMQPHQIAQMQAQTQHMRNQDALAREANTRAGELHGFTVGEKRDTMDERAIARLAGLGDPIVNAQTPEQQNRVLAMGKNMGLDVNQYQGPEGYAALQARIKRHGEMLAQKRAAEEAGLAKTQSEAEENRAKAAALNAQAANADQNWVHDPNNPGTIYNKKTGERRVDPNAAANDPASKKFQEAAATAQVKRLDDMITHGSTQQSNISDLNTLRDISGRIGAPGIGNTVTRNLGPMARAVGVEMTGMSDMEAFTAIISKMVPLARPPGSGTMSDKDVDLFRASLPTLAATAQGRGFIMDQMEAMSQYSITRANIASKVLNQELPRQEGERLLREMPDPMALFRAQVLTPKAIKEGRDAIAKGVPREKVIQRMRENKLDPSGL